LRVLRAILTFFTLFGDDILAITGLAVICRATFMWSAVAGWYSIGLILCLFAFVWSKNVPKPPKNR
jgi:hypothetical protein